jgi:hypothetical protein
MELTMRSRVHNAVLAASPVLAVALAMVIEASRRWA